MERKVLASTVAPPAPQNALEGKRFYRTREVSEFFAEKYGLRVTVPALDTLVTRGGGPTYRKWGKCRVYEESDLIAWAEARMSPPRASSSEAV